MGISYHLYWFPEQPSLLGFGNKCLFEKIAGYDLSSSFSPKGVIKALKMGLKQRSYKAHNLIHY